MNTCYAFETVEKRSQQRKLSSSQKCIKKTKRCLEKKKCFGFGDKEEVDFNFSVRDQQKPDFSGMRQEIADYCLKFGLERRKVATRRGL